MRSRLLFSLVCCVAAALSGCGGGSAQGGSTGRAAFTITWPDRSRLVPVAANSVVVVIRNATNEVARKVVARPAAGGVSTVEIPDLPPGELTVSLTATPNADGTGVAQAAASAPLVIQAGGTTPIALTMNSTIEKVRLTTPTQTLMVGDSETLVATAYDVGDNVVLTLPSTVRWTASNGVVRIADGVVTGQSIGTTTVTATEIESGKSQSVNLAVTGMGAPVTQQSVAMQVNPAHSGAAVFGKPLNFPSVPTWSVELGGVLSYPLIANGRVYVVSSTDGKLRCLELTTGQTLWTTSAGGFRTHAYDQGRVFLLNRDGLLQEIDAVTGQPGWSASLPGQYMFSATPTAAYGMVYAGGAGTGGTVYGLDASNGALRWTQGVANGDQSSPAVTADGLFVSYPCQTYKLSLTNGSVLWHYEGGCSGGGGWTDAVANGRVYARDFPDNHVFDAATGAALGSYRSERLPALGATVGCFLESGTLRGRRLQDDSVLWSFAADGTLVTAPILIDETVFIGSSSGTVYALNVQTGQQVWSGDAGAPIAAPDEWNVATPVSGFGAGQGYLIVAAGSRMTAWRLAGP